MMSGDPSICKASRHARCVPATARESTKLGAVMSDHDTTAYPNNVHNMNSAFYLIQASQKHVQNGAFKYTITINCEQIIFSLYKYYSRKKESGTR